MNFIQKEQNGDIFIKILAGDKIPENVYKGKCNCTENCSCGDDCKCPEDCDCKAGGECICGDDCNCKCDCSCDCYFEIETQAEEMIHEKHLPVVEKKEDKILVKVGEVQHPMMEEHQIQFILAEREDGVEIKYLKPNEKPEATFDAEGVIAVYEYCNLHGLWKTEIE